ncbi:MAG: NAD(P)-dependent oxidoreductase [Gemmatimonadaceae bacterium]
MWTRLMRIAVSGATGFIGQHVLRELHSRGLDAIALTRSARGRHPQPGVSRWVDMDIAHAPPNPFAAIGKPDVLIHLAWGGLPNYQSDHHVDVELPEQLAFLTACIEGGLQRLAVTGTCYEYGLVTGELTEEMPANPCTQYGRAKDTLRKALFDLRAHYDLDLAWLRLFYLYGDGQSEKSLYHALHAAIDRGDKSFDMSGGEQLRDFLSVQEAASAIVNLSLSTKANGIFNICSGTPTRVRDIVQSWINNARAALVMNLGKLPYSPNEPLDFWGSRNKLDRSIDATNQ